MADPSGHQQREVYAKAARDLRRYLGRNRRSNDWLRENSHLILGVAVVLEGAGFAPPTHQISRQGLDMLATAVAALPEPSGPCGWEVHREQRLRWDDDHVFQRSHPTGRATFHCYTHDVRHTGPAEEVDRVAAEHVARYRPAAP